LKRSILVVVAFAFSIAAFAAEDTFYDRTNGVMLVKPFGWEIAPPLPKAEGSEARQALRIIQISKYPAGHEGPNPSFVMSLQPVPFAARGLSPAAMLRQLVPNLSRALPAMEFEAQPRDVPVPDLNRTEMLVGGEMLFHHTARDAAGQPYQARSRMMYIRRGDQLFSVQTTSPASGPDASNAELNDLLASIRIAR
jgi:hypothetical protein